MAFWNSGSAVGQHQIRLNADGRGMGGHVGKEAGQLIDVPRPALLH